MKKIKIIFLLVLLSVSVQPAGLPAADKKADVITVGIFPRRNSVNTVKMFNPLMIYLGKKLNRKVRLVTAKDFRTFWEGVVKREYDIVHYNQYHYVKSHKENGYDVILRNIEFGEDTISGAIIVRKDSGINKVSDLKGKKIVFGGGPKAMQSYIVASYLLQKNGLEKSAYESTFAKNPPNAIMSTFFKQSDAAGSGDKVLQLKVVKNQIRIDDMKYLVSGEQLPHLPWAVKKELPDELKMKIQKILHNLVGSKQGKLLLKKVRLDGFAMATDSDYDEHRKIIKEVLNESY